MHRSSAGTLQRNGSTIHYWLSGPEGRPLVAFTHGAGLGHRMFDMQVEALADEYRVLTWDVRGQAHSQPMGRDFSIASCAADLLALIRNAGYEQAVVVGESMGSYIAQEFVYRYPQQALALVSIGATGITQVHARIDRWGLSVTPKLIRWLPYRIVRDITAGNSGITEVAQQHAYHSLLEIRQRDFARSMGAIPRGLHPEPGYVIPVPALLTHGVYDRIVRVPAYAPGWHAQQPNSILVAIPEAGHNANQDNPAFFNRILLDFLHQHVPSTRVPEPMCLH